MRSIRTNLPALGLAMGMIAPLSAATFPATDSAGADAVAVVDAGGGGDYLTLAAAAADFNAMTGGMARNWTIEIASDLTEAANVSIANATNGFNLTIKPAASTTPTITFTQTTDNPMVPGHLVIGSALSSWTLSTMSNVVIDGSNNGTDSRDLTLINSDATSFPNSRIVRVVGNVTNSTIKNCVITNRSTAGSTPFAIEWSNRDNNYPNDSLTENNLITSTTSLTAIGIGFASYGSATSGNATTGAIIRGNDITARNRGMSLARNAGTTTIEDNIIRINQTTSGYMSWGIFHIGSGGVTSFNMIIRNNEFLQLATANGTAGNLGIAGIQLDPGGEGTSVQIHNNTFTGISANGTAGDWVVQAIALSSSSSTYLVEHNSIYMPPVNATGATPTRLAGIVTPFGIWITGSLTTRNNIILWEDDNGYAINAGAGPFASAGNNIVTSSATLGRRDTSDYADLAAWQAAGFDTTATGGQSVNPTTTAPGAWVDKTANLRFTGGPAIPMVAVASSTVLTDIDGQARPATEAWPGAYEVVGVTVPVELDMFQVD